MNYTRIILHTKLSPDKGLMLFRDFGGYGATIQQPALLTDKKWDPRVG